MGILSPKNFIPMLIAASLISYLFYIQPLLYFGQPTNAAPLYTSTRHFFDTDTGALIT